MAFWYKPYLSHPHLYPSAKNEDRQAVRETLDSEEQYRVCPYGMEIFRTKGELKHVQCVCTASRMSLAVH
eukprot:1887315-Pleurochrysis_carterae.AAC.1